MGERALQLLQQTQFKVFKMATKAASVIGFMRVKFIWAAKHLLNSDIELSCTAMRCMGGISFLKTISLIWWQVWRLKLCCRLRITAWIGYYSWDCSWSKSIAVSGSATMVNSIAILCKTRSNMVIFYSSLSIISILLFWLWGWDNVILGLSSVAST